MAGELAGLLGIPVELRIGTGPAASTRPYLAFPGGEVVRLDATGRPESTEDALRRLPQQLQDGLLPYRGRPELETRLAALHDAEVAALADLAAGVTELLATLNRSPHRV